MIQAVHQAATVCREITARDILTQQYGLINSREFGRLLSDLLPHVITDGDVIRIWMSGLLRSDFIHSNVPISKMHIDRISSSYGYTYIDNREVPLRKTGWGGSFRKDIPKNIKQARILFHPYRVYVVYQLIKATKVNSAPFQFFLWEPGLESIAKRWRKFLRKYSSTDRFTEFVERANCLCELTIALEPVTYEQIFKSIVWRHPETENTIESKIRKRLNQIAPVIDTIGLKTLEKLRTSLCREAQIIDRNPRLHVLHRLMNSRTRQQLKGGTGLCQLMLTMAETLRRVSEQHFTIKLPEEDESGFGQWMIGARKTLYGTDRVYDASTTDKRPYLWQMGLDHGVRIRCYVEGTTEYSALSYTLGAYDIANIINLRGQVVEKGGRGLAFRESLRRDIKEGVFSFIFIDGDRSDYVSAVRTAAKDNEIVGAFFISEPDFEFSNFNIDELVLVACQCLDVSLSTSEQNKLISICSNCISMAELEKTMRNSDARFTRFSKGPRWGEELIAYGLANPSFPNELQDQKRPIISALELVFHAFKASYSISRRNGIVDSESGLPINLEDNQNPTLTSV